MAASFRYRSIPANVRYAQNKHARKSVCDKCRKWRRRVWFARLAASFEREWIEAGKVRHNAFGTARS
jgi:hypothetical protein